MIKITKEEAQAFLLYRQGLLGDKIFSGKMGILDYIKRVGSIQFDPVDVCGISPEIALQARVENFDKQLLAVLLYKERKLIDFFDKNLCIFPVEDLPMFVQKYAGISYAESMARQSNEQVLKMIPKIREILVKENFVFAKDLRHLEVENIVWDWGASSSVARAALETMYFHGELIIHHKTGRQKAYGLAEKFLSSKLIMSQQIFESEADYYQQLVLRRIGAVGLLWNKRSDAWLGIENFKAQARNQAFQELLSSGAISEVAVSGLTERLYMKSTDKALLAELSALTEGAARVEFLAPLDSLLWDRNLIKEVFDFDYKWEIYTPKEKRKYGAYVLPVIYGRHFVGRVEIERRTKESVLAVKNFWLEENEKFTPELEQAFSTCVERFKLFNACEKIEYVKGWRARSG